MTWFSKANRTSDSFLITYPAFLLSCFLLPYHRHIAGEKQWKAFGSSVVLVELAGVDGATPPIPAKKFTLLGVLHSVWELIQYSCVGLFYCFCCCFWYFLLLLLGLYFFSCLHTVQVWGEERNRNTCCQVTIVTGHMKSSFNPCL